ncbi:HAD domain-containing protein [Paraburkholderia sp. RL17-380-BIE-A]|uniref:HAD domain-containing protein n=1 Tax=Paraburkholderia sp. RL17-380-BIE-A TaxID=3031630 RepID=UPI0038B94F4B
MVATMASHSILYLAVEGVLLRRTFAPPRLGRGAIYLAIDSAPVTQLSALLVEEQHVDVVLTSSWVNTVGFHCVLDLLPESLGAHVVGATIPGNRLLRHRLSQNTSKSEWLAEDVRRRQPQVVTVLESDARHVPVPLRDEVVIVPNGLWAADHDDWRRLRRMLARKRCMA